MASLISSEISYVFVGGEERGHEVGVKSSQTQDGPDSEETDQHLHYSCRSVLQGLQEVCVLRPYNSAYHPPSQYILYYCYKTVINVFVENYVLTMPKCDPIDRA